MSREQVALLREAVHDVSSICFSDLNSAFKSMQNYKFVANLSQST